ncbi:MAG: hypothetical protein R6T91_01325 [Bacteroidales bacterium]
MDTRQIIHFIHKPGALDEGQKETLHRLVKQYPFCSSLHMLWVKTLKNLQHQDFEKELQHSSAFVHDRDRLSFLVNENHKGINEKIEPEAPEAKHAKPMSNPEKEALIQERLRQIEKEQQYQQHSGSTPKQQDEAIKKPQKEQSVNKDKLIDRFIQNAPRIEAVEDADFSQEVKIADDSLKQKDEFVSETLARIYERQNKTKKAIEIYEKLSLKFPEKKRYFANLIDELKNR